MGECKVMLFKRYVQFRYCISDLIDSPIVKDMNNYIQHSCVTTLEHCVFVSYLSFLMCRFLGLNYYAAARGGLLHDLFLYDWHDSDKRGKLHGFTHPTAALKNACEHFELTNMEKDIIKKHMWPLTISFPKYKESYIVSLADKLCTCIEVFGFHRIIWIKRIMRLKTVREKMVIEMLELEKNMDYES